MPGDGLAFAVVIRCQVNRIGLGRLGFQFTDDAALAFARFIVDDDVSRLEAMVDVHAHVLGRQVADVPERGFDGETGA